MMKRIFSLLTVVMVMAITASAAPEAPDFAYPKQVEKDARAALSAARKRGDDVAALRALINLTVARNKVDVANAQESIDLIKEYAADASTAAPARAIANVMLARMYMDIYNSQQWVFNEREIPLEPLPADFNEWSQAQFAKVIRGYIDASMADAEALKKEPLEKYADIVEHNEFTYIYYPTLYDFVATQAIACSGGAVFTYNMPGYMPAEMLEPWPQCEKVSMVTLSEPQRFILNTYNSLLAFHDNRSTASMINYSLSRIDYVRSMMRDADTKMLLNTAKNLYNRYNSSQYSGDILQSTISGSDYKWRYDRCVENIEKYPSYYAIKALQNIVGRLSNKVVDLQFPSICAPGSQLELHLTGDNVNELVIDVYKVNPRNNTLGIKYSEIKGLKPIESIPVSVEGTVPFEIDRKVTYTAPDYGHYVLVPRFEGSTRSDYDNLDILNVTSLALVKTQYEKPILFVVNPLTGAPVRGAQLLGVDERYVKSDKMQTITVFKGKSDDMGRSVYSAKTGSEVYATDGVSFSPRMWIYSQDSKLDTEGFVTSLNIYTSLALYHPGDSVQWSLTLAKATVAGALMVPGRTVTVKMYDANGQVADQEDVVTDDFGRAAGVFVTQAGLLSGEYRIQATCEMEGERRAYGSHYFTVSDYKLPTFEIKTDTPLKNYPDSAAVTLRGVVNTYSGFPVADAKVKMSLSSAPMWRWWGTTSAPYYYAPEVTTDADGRYEIVLPADLLKVAPMGYNGRFVAGITVTSPAGETQTAEQDFTTRKALNIEASGIGSVVDASNPVTLKVQVLDNENKPVDATLQYTLTSSSSNSVVKQGDVSTGSNTLDWKNIPGAKYTIKLYCEGDSCVINDVTVYRPTDKYSPSTDVLWTPTTTIKTMAGEMPKVLVGTTGTAVTHVLVSTYNGTGYLDQRWVDLKPGLHYIDLPGPDDTHPFNVELLAFSNFNDKRIQLSVVPDASVKNVKMEISSFRDKLVPGDLETWQIHVTDNRGAGLESAVMIDMYNKALDCLAVNSFSMHTPCYPLLSYYSNITNLKQLESIRTRGKNFVEYNKLPQVVIPNLNLWGQRLYDGAYRGGGVIMMKQNMARYSMSAKEESIDDASAPTMSMASMNMMSDTGGAEAVERKVSGDASSDGSVVNPHQENYRPAEVPLALFEPLLTTDTKGNLNFTFTVPNANTTWALKTIAFTHDAITACDTRQIVTSKPVMVQSNLPRFLRTGDDAKLLATVMNNSDEQQFVTTIVTIFDPATGKEIKEAIYENYLQPMESTVVEITTGVIGEQPMVGYRVRATAGRYTDGEQSAVPVLSTVSPVIETKTFYSQPQQRDITLTVPDAKSEGDRLTLQYTENPLWTVVTALPGLRQNKITTSPEAGYSIFSAALAQHILKSYPEVAAALRYWSTSDRSPATLTSMLQQNAELKAILLEATPWMVDAMNDTERMQRLALLFDKKECDRTINNAVDVLSKCVGSDGGWRWCDFAAYDKQSSQWATEQVLTLLGYLNVNGAMPDNKKLDKMVENAVNYIDKQAVADFKKYPNADYSFYAYLRTLYPEVRLSTGAQKVSAAAVKRMSEGWKKHGSATKAFDALVLYRSNYASTAKQILNSLREYAIYTPAQGMTWKESRADYGSVFDNAVILTAFATVEPGCADIDKIRQWLILQKEALNWGTSAATSAAVNAIFSTSQAWVKPAVGSRFYLNGTEFIPADAPEAYSGYVRTTLNPEEAAGKTLMIVKGTETPAYGALYCQYQARMDTIAPASCDAVQIEKFFYVQNADGTWRQAKKLKVGDRVKVDLLIKATRDMDYVAIIDDRAACLEPVEQLPEPIWSEGICFYRENADATTRMFVQRMPRGTYRLSYELFVNNDGRFTSGIATIQSQYAPQMTAHSAGSILTVSPALN